ncbi:MAG: choice-of-anchor D domain-containing protein [Proteobacteria bacterium]|nr:choice-of-anchor D domain-containing protein [Pseudomonadota bacterium]
MAQKIIIQLMCMFLWAGFASAVDLPKTGQTTCRDNFGTINCTNTGQDGDTQAGLAWPDPRFTDNGDGTLTDNLTGLIWLQNANCFGYLNFPDALTYANSVLQNNVCGLTDGSALGDWRLPNINELRSLINSGDNTVTWLNTQGFINVQDVDYVTSTTYAYDTTKVWRVELSSDYTLTYNKVSGGFNFLAVRGTSTGPAQVLRTGQSTSYLTGDDGDFQAGAVLPSPRFSDNGDGTVTDNITTLIWLKNAECFGKQGWYDALADANSLADGLCGLTDGSAAGEWHLPNRVEMRSLIDYSQSLPALTPGHSFVNLPSVNSVYWTSTNYGTDTAWYISMGDGGLATTSKLKVFPDGWYAWPVKGGGVVTPVPDITVTDSAAPATDLDVVFGDVTLNTSSDQTVTITNDGSADLVIGLIAQANPVAGAFSILNDTCSSQTLNPDASCTFTVRFTPDAVDAFVESFDIPSNDVDENPVTMVLHGNGIGTPAPDITLDVLQIPFGSVTENTTVDQVVTVTNNGNADLVLGTVGASDTLAAPYSIINDNCSAQTLTPAANCTLTVRFAPLGIGSFNDSFDVPSNDPDENPVTVNVSGTGAATPVADIAVSDSVTPADDHIIPFADLTVGVSGEQTVTIENLGSADLVIGQIAQNNPLAAPFTIINDNCSTQTIAPSASCTFTVRFAPIAAEAFSDSLDIPSNDPDENPVTINVSGTGLSAATNNPPSAPQLLSPANGQQGVATTLVTLTYLKGTDPDADPLTYELYLCTDSDPFNNCQPYVNPTAAVVAPKIPAGPGNGTMMLFAFTLTVLGAAHFLQRRKGLAVGMLLTAGVLLVSCSGGNHDPNQGSFTASNLAPDTTYYWSVAADDGNGGQTPSDTRHFTTGNEAE